MSSWVVIQVEEKLVIVWCLCSMNHPWIDSYREAGQADGIDTSKAMNQWVELTKCVVIIGRWCPSFVLIGRTSAWNYKTLKTWDVLGGNISACCSKTNQSLPWLAHTYPSLQMFHGCKLGSLKMPSAGIEIGYGMILTDAATSPKNMSSWKGNWPVVEPLLWYCCIVPVIGRVWCCSKAIKGDSQVQCAVRSMHRRVSYM
jgi:hypothetical protein